MTTIDTGQISVRGNATAEELAAVVAAVARRQAAGLSSDEPSRYEQWRQARIAVLRRDRDTRA